MCRYLELQLYPTPERVVVPGEGDRPGDGDGAGMVGARGIDGDGDGCGAPGGGNNDVFNAFLNLGKRIAWAGKYDEIGTAYCRESA